jgi:alpha-tubulin suppressor-like RCC1 family protein
MQLGDGTNYNRIAPTLILNQNFKTKQMSAGVDFSLLLSTEGRLYSFGNANVRFYLFTKGWANRKWNI